jgi:YidC/Oxa1 family membrane protein insertase
MDRNSTIGLVLISVLLFAYFQFMAPDPTKLPAEAKTEQKADNSKKQAIISNADTKVSDSVLIAQSTAMYGKFATAIVGDDKSITLENADVRLTFSTKGGRVKEVLLKNYKTFDAKPVVLIDSNNAKLGLSLPTAKGNIDLSQLYFKVVSQTTNAVTFALQVNSNEVVEQTYTLPAKGYKVNYGVKVNLAQGTLKNEPVLLSSNVKFKRTEKDVKQSQITSNINFFADGEFDNLSEASLEEQKEEIPTALNWVSFKSKFFNIGFISEKGFTKGNVKSVGDEKDTLVLKEMSADMYIPTSEVTLAEGAKLVLYFGPNDLDVLNEVTPNFGDNVHMGWPVIKHINRYIIYPIFTLLEMMTSNYGIIIFLLVVILKLVLFPLSYKSYIAMAKMRVLKPEIDAIKEQTGDDMTKTQQETMKLYQQVGVNPLSGCVPMLLSAPFLIAMFSFFPNLIDLRQQSFLWADDLSSYDSVYTLPFEIFSYGTHVSLFTILMTISTIVYTWMNNQVSTVQGPMKVMSYVMPVMFMFILNSLAAGLTYYYLVSNVVSIVQQYVIKMFVDEDQIKEKLMANKINNANGNGKKPGGFMGRLQEAMKAQEEMQRNKKK